MDEKYFYLRISGDKFAHEQEIDSVQKAKIISFLMLPDSNLGQPETPHSASAVIPSVPANFSPTNASPREYMNDKSPVTMPQKMTVIVQYLRETQQKEYVTKEDVQKAFDEAREPFDTKNFSRDFDRAIKNGWIHYSTSEGKYFITPTGDTAVTSKFENAVRKVPHKKGSGNRKKVLISVRPELASLDLQPDVEGYRYYWKLNNGEKVLWLLAQASDKGHMDLNFKEISRLADVVGDHIEPKQITSLVATHVKSKRVFPLSPNNIKVLRISPLGLEYVKNTSQGS